LWYPLWDAGLKLGHAVRSFGDQLSLARGRPDTATSLLSVRHLAGDEELASRLATDGVTLWRRRGPALARPAAGPRARAPGAGRRRRLPAGADLKDGHGGLRDVQTLWWAAAADLLVRPDDLALLDDCYGTLVDARVELHRTTGGPGTCCGSRTRTPWPKASAPARPTS
jgi:[protein-PII] uridylyltransferase